MGVINYIINVSMDNRIILVKIFYLVNLVFMFLLEYSPKEKAWKRNEERPLKGDLIIVDEASMIDLILMHQKQ
ncbi:hypothetical protein HY02_09825, partial [Peptococcaceae bacterium SCADC1_2_3]